MNDRFAYLRHQSKKMVRVIGQAEMRGLTKVRTFSALRGLPLRLLGRLAFSTARSFSFDIWIDRHLRKITRRQSSAAMTHFWRTSRGTIFLGFQRGNTVQRRAEADAVFAAD
jgi:hypothetical protein